MKTSTLLTSVLLIGLLPLAALAQSTPTLSDHPGYFPMDDLQILPLDDVTVEINLQGAMLKLVAMATRDDPEFSKLISGIEAIRVQVAEIASSDLTTVRAAMDRAAKLLDERGWQRIVRVRDQDEEVYIYNREKDGSIVGMTVLVLESEEATIVNLVGFIDVEMLGSLAIGLDIPQLGVALDTVNADPTDPNN